jgi:hypothetical protein
MRHLKIVGDTQAYIKPSFLEYKKMKFCNCMLKQFHFMILYSLMMAAQR